MKFITEVIAGLQIAASPVIISAVLGLMVAGSTGNLNWLWICIAAGVLLGVRIAIVIRNVVVP